MKFRALIFSVIFTLFTVGYSIAGPPLATDDTGTVEAGKVEIELNGSYIFDKTSDSGITTRTRTADTEMKITTGLYKNLGLALAIPYTFSSRTTENDSLVSSVDGLGDMTLELKYLFTEAAGFSFALKPFVIMPTGKDSAGLSEGRWQFGGTLIATREFDEGNYAVHANVGYEHHDYRTAELRTATRSNLWFASLAGEMKINKKLTAVLDLGLAGNPDKTSGDLPVYGLAGARYEFNDYLDLNVGVKLGLTEPEDDIAVLYGLTLKF